MKQDEKTVEEIMNRALGRHSSPPAEQVESASNRVWQTVQSRRSDRSSDVVPDNVRIHSRRRMWLPAVAGVAAITLLAVFLSRPHDEGTAENHAAGPIRMGELLRSDDQGAVFVLEDGSRIEMRAKSELRVERADDGVRIRLNSGGVIVTAAKQRTGHLYVETKDMTVSVVGTVFFVNAEEEGSRVAVIQGEVQVQQGTTSRKLLPGEHVATNPAMKSPPVSEEIAWSRSAEMHLALLEQVRAVVPDPLKFDAASIKPAAPGRITANGPVYCRGVDGFFSPNPQNPNNDPSTTPLGRCLGRHVGLVMLISAAYDVQVRNISGGPDWTGVYRSPIEYFDVEASAENAGTTTKEHLRQMLQTLLADRFKLKIRRGTRQAPGYALVVAKGGLKLNRTEGEDERFSMRITGSGGGMLERTFSGKGSVSAFASWFGVCMLAGFPLVDKTELAGSHDFKLTLNYIVPTAPPSVQPGGPVVLPCTTEYDPPVSKALENQLGLGLQSHPVPEDFIVIEHAEKPSEN